MSAWTDEPHKNGGNSFNEWERRSTENKLYPPNDIGDHVLPISVLGKMYKGLVPVGAMHRLPNVCVDAFILHSLLLHSSYYVPSQFRFGTWPLPPGRSSWDANVRSYQLNSRLSSPSCYTTAGSDMMKIPTNGGCFSICICSWPAGSVFVR